MIIAVRMERAKVTDCLKAAVLLAHRARVRQGISSPSLKSRFLPLRS
jgi:hypothetical protein